MNHNLIIRLKPVWSRSFSIAGVRPDWGVTKISYASILLLLLLALFSKFIQFFSKHSFSQKLHKSCKAPFWVTLLQQSKISAQTPLRIQLCQEATNHTHKKWLERMRATFCRQKPVQFISELMTVDRRAGWGESEENCCCFPADSGSTCRLNWFQELGRHFLHYWLYGHSKANCRKLEKNFSNFQSISAMVASDHSWFKKNQI